MLVGNRARLHALRSRGAWPPTVPSVVLAESLTGDHRRDFHENRLLRLCFVDEVNEDLARLAGGLRTAAGGAPPPSAVDAIVVALAERIGGASVLTSDPRDLRALAHHTVNRVRIVTG